MNTMRLATLLGGALLSASLALGRGEEPPWAEIVGAPEGAWPEPQGEVVWRADLDAALDEARASGRPLFVTLRCLPCHQCAEFDQDLLEGGPELDPLLGQFVTVRLTDAWDLDLDLLPMEGFQDMDLSWWGWFLSPEGRVYGVFGGKDHVSDATRISLEALRNTLARVLDHHYDPRRARWDVDGPAPTRSGDPRTPADLPGYASWDGKGGVWGECLHCHQVVEILRQPAIDSGAFDKRRDLRMWPLPENVGLVVDRDDGLRVESVLPESAAERAGVRAGDTLAVAGDRRLFGQADLRGVLHRAPVGEAEVSLRWLRDGELHAGTLGLADGWRETVIHWRTSVSQGNIGAHPGFAWANAAPAAVRAGRGIPDGSMAIRPWFGPDREWPAWRAGLRGSDVIVAIDGESPDVLGREFMTWFRLRYDPGDTVVFTARDERGDDRELRFALP